MPVITRKRSARILITVAAAVPLVLAMGVALITVFVGQSCSGGGGAGDTPSRTARRDLPADFLRIYEQVGAKYKIPWEILAGIGTEECENGQFPAPSCTPIPGARGPGVANFAGASGPMAIGIGGAAGDAYDALRHYLPNPALGPHDRTTAVELAALVLIKDKGAPTGKPIDAYWRYAEAYNGSGPAAAAYADRVIADAHAYQGPGTASVSVTGCVGAPGGYINPFKGEAWAPARNDMGVDYDPLKVEPVRAIGAGTIVSIGSWGMYGPWFDYRLAGGRFAGKCIYVAEHIGSILKPGTRFSAGETVATSGRWPSCSTRCLRCARGGAGRGRGDLDRWDEDPRERVAGREPDLREAGRGHPQGGGGDRPE